MGKKSGVHYVDNKKLYAEMVKFIAAYRESKQNNTPKPRVPEYIGECIIKIASRLSNRPNFIGYTYKEEMIGDGIENVLAYIHNFNPDKHDNPFAYFTMIINNAFIRRLQKEKKQTYIKHKMLERGLVENSLSDNSGGDHHVNLELNTDGRLDSLIDNFEKKHPKKKKAKGIEKFIETDELIDASEV
jgi:DNA-directed RNA polymerase specialized sigma subunit